MWLRKLLLTAITVMCLPLFSFSAITININSGNPRMPFPQFLDYVGGKTLATNWPDGVSHAEMEMYMRDAWKIHSNEFVYAGTVTYQNAAGANVNVNLIRDTSSPYCSEGHGYALLGAALMCDKDAFDGLWFYLVENNYFNKSRIYSTGAIYNPGYNFGAWAPAWAGPGSDAATDGDDDIALACLIAWKQWGDNTGYYAPGGSGANNTAGRPAIQYRQMALDLMRFMVAKDEGDIVGDIYWDSGDIGFDGYVKGGNTWPELTNWGALQPGDKPNRGGTQANSYYDYTAPGYYRCFAATLEANGDPAWNYTQFYRATASSNWVMGQLAASAHKTIEAGQYTVVGSTVTFQNFNPGGEDFRAPLRNILDYLWKGNPTDHWDPVSHSIVAGGNNSQYLAAIKQANFLKDPQAQGVACKSYGSSPITYRGIAALTQYNLNGSEFWSFHLNRFGASAPAIVASQDFDLMGQFLRELMIEWDTAGGTDNYLGSTPAYFHGFFRQVGLMILTGNWPSACDIAATANMKVYKAVDKTYAFPGDYITYWINYRNYGSSAATNVIIRDTIPAAFSHFSSTPAGTPLGGNVYEWTFASVPGLQNQNYNATMGGITLVVRVNDNAAQGRYCNFADIRCSNGSGFRSSEFPNEVSTIMKRNCVDIVSAALTITKTANVAIVNPGNTVTYTIDFCNSAEAAGWMNGGRSGINWAGGVKVLPGASTDQLYVDFSAHHEAAEPVIDWGNYRVSYFLNSPYHGAQWGLSTNSISPFSASLNLTTEDFVACMPAACTDGTGKYWNQRLMFNFPSLPSAPTHHLYNYFGMMSRIHVGTVQAPFYFEARVYQSGYLQQDWTDDWSQQTAATVVVGPDKMMWPISPDWTKGDGTSVVVNKVNKHACETTATTIQNILVEEWDGYTWRRVFGNGPMAGREVTGVKIIDSLPAYMNFGGFVGNTMATYTAGTRTINWNYGNMQINQCGQLKYWVVVADPGCPKADTPQLNIASVRGDKEAPVSESALVTIRCVGGSPTCTPTFTRTSTPTQSSTATLTHTLTSTLTRTPSMTSSRTYTPSYTATLTSTLTSTLTQTLTRTMSFTPTFTLTQNNTSTFTNTASPTPTFTHTNSRTPSPTFTPSVSVTVTNTHTNTFTNTYTPTSTRTVSPSLTVTDTISSNTPTHTLTSTNTFTATQTWTSSASPTSTVPTATFTHTNSMTASPTFSATRTYTDTYTFTSTNTATATFTYTPTLTHSLTVTDTMSSNTPTHTPTWTNTFTPTQSWTETSTRTFTPTFTDTVTQTGTPVIFTYTVTPSFTDTSTYTSTPTPSSTATETPTYTATNTHTQTLTVTSTSTATATPTATATVTDTSTITPTPRPSPVTLDIRLEVTGEDPAAGALVTYVIWIENNTSSPVSNVAVWDTLHQDMMFVSNDFEIAPVQTGNYLYWDVSTDSLGNPFTLNPGEHIRIEFTARINAVVPARQPFTNTVMTDYTDPFYVLPAKHPALASDMEFYPIGKPVVFPNPFNLDTDTVVTFDNIVPGSLIQIYTVSGESVKAIYAGIKTATWDSKNRNGKAVSPGIYYFVIKNQSNNEVKKGKIFVVRGN